MSNYQNLRISILLHETGMAAAENIMRERNFRPSRSGYIGPGVYFAENKGACHLKANRKEGSFIISAVKLGKLLEVYHPDGSLTQEKVRQHGYDSVRGYRSKAPDALCFNTGTEYCVFDTSRITVLFAQIDNCHNIHYLFNTDRGIVRYDDIPLDKLLITITENQITVGDTENNIFSTLTYNEPNIKGLKLIYTNEDNFEFTKVVQKIG